MKPAANWIFPPPVDIPADLQHGIAGSDFLLECLVRRGLTSAESAAGFLDFTQYTPSPPESLPGMDKAVARILAAVAKHETVGVWGDFDVDGQTATAVMVDTLRKIGADVRFHIPVRGRESHGINLEPLKNFLTPSMKLMLTCDTGISESEAAAYLHSVGVDLVITDHHQLPDTLPDALAILNPQFLPQDHPLRDLAGVGVAFKLAEALLISNRISDFTATLHDLVALGCIADLAILRGDTRYLVQSGLNRMRTSPRLFLVKMAEMLQLSLDRLNEEDIGFYIAPRMNAIGRLDDANPMVDFLLATDPGEIAPFLTHMEALNASRRVLVSQVFQGCLAQLEANPDLSTQPVVILSHPEWPGGVVGIAASHLAELVHHPVILLSGPQNGILRGSARSVPGIDITGALTQNKDLLLAFGGHPMAAGLSVTSERLTEFRARMQQSVREMEEEHHIEAELPVETALNLNQVDFNLLADLDRLAPFGPGNPSPVFAAPGLIVRDASVLGRNADHRQVMVEDARGNEFRVLWWQGADLPLPEGRFDLAYTAHLNIYKGNPQVQYEWIDSRPSQERAPIPRRKSSIKRDLLDYRQMTSVTPEIQALIDAQGGRVWREGIIAQPPSLNRTQLEKSSCLVIQTIPPTSTQLFEAITRVTPATIIFMGETPAEDDLGILLKELGILLKQALNESDKIFSSEALAARFATTTEIIHSALDWYAAKGWVTITPGGEGQFGISTGDESDAQKAASLQVSLVHLANEVSSFRRYYLNVALESLVSIHEK